MLDLRFVGWYASSMVGAMVGFAVFSLIGFVAIDATVGAFTDDVEAALEDPYAFAVVLTIAFALGGAGLGLGQWVYLRRKVRRAGRWVGLMALSFATIALTYNVLVIAAGEQHLDDPWGRLANELAHTIATGVFIAWLSWRTVGKVNGAAHTRWLVLVAAAFPATGLTVWGLEQGLDAAGGDVNPLGMLVFGAFMAAAWAPALAGRRPASAPVAAPEGLHRPGLP